MYSSALYTGAHAAIENCPGLRQLFEILPPNTELSIFLDSRIYATLTYNAKILRLEPRKSTTADVEIILFSESIRRLRDHAPNNLAALVILFTELIALGHAKVKLLAPLLTLCKRGYMRAFQSIKSLAKL